MPRALLVLFAALFAASAAGCSSTRQIETERPRPATPQPAAPPSDGPRADLVVHFETGTTALPEDVDALRFRVVDLRFRQRDGAWTTYPADFNTFEVRRGEPVQRKAVLATHLPAAAYDSLAVTLGSVYVQYGPNAGGPVTMPHDAPVRLPFTLQPQPGRPATLVLTFEPGASLSRSADCRWFFLPFLFAAPLP